MYSIHLLGTNLVFVCDTLSPCLEHLCQNISKYLNARPSNSPDKVFLSHFWPLTSMCDWTFELWTWVTCATHYLHVLNICVHVFQNPSILQELNSPTRFSCLIFHVWPACVTLTFELWTWFLHTELVHTLNICARLFQNPSMYDQITALNSFICLNLTFDLYVWLWHLSYEPGPCVGHTVSIPWTSVPRHLKIPKCMTK